MDTTIQIAYDLGRTSALGSDSPIKRYEANASGLLSDIDDSLSTLNDWRKKHVEDMEGMKKLYEDVGDENYDAGGENAAVDDRVREETVLTPRENSAILSLLEDRKNQLPEAPTGNKLSALETADERLDRLRVELECNEMSHMPSACGNAENDEALSLAMSSNAARMADLERELNALDSEMMADIGTPRGGGVDSEMEALFKKMDALDSIDSREASVNPNQA
jgi:hypothetical protein